MAGRPDEREAAAQRRLDRRPRRERRRLERRRRCRACRRRARPAPRRRGRARRARRCGRAAAPRPSRRGPRSRSCWCVEQHREPLGPLGVVARRVQVRERRMRQDVDSACARRSATPPRPSRSSESGRLRPRRVMLSARGGRGAEASIVAIRRKSRKSSASAAKRPSASAASSVPYCASSVGRLLRADPARARELVGRVAAQRDEVRHLLRLDAVALAHLRRADPRELAHAARRLQDRDAVADELERVAVGGRDEHVARPRLRARPRGSRRPRSPAPSPTRSRTRAATLRQQLELLEDRLLEHAPRLVRLERLVPVGRHGERVPADEHRVRPLAPPRAATSMFAKPTTALSRIDFGSAW